MAHTIRDDMVDYTRQAVLDEDLSIDAIGTWIIVGCGGIGTWTGILLAMLGVDNMILIDKDKVDSSNLNRLPYPQTFIGQNKAIALRKMITMLRPTASVVSITTNVDKDNVELFKPIFSSNNQRGYYASTTNYIIDATDDAEVQRAIYNFTTDYNTLKYIKIGYEGYQVGAYKDMGVWVGEDYQRGYRTAQSNVITSAVASGLGIFSALLNRRDSSDVEVNLRELIRKSARKSEVSGE